ncbi:MAG: hypothetical protein Q4A78_07935 [Peptostreptococcaceae bacterium]|nr:hypothetical protein [Peptostreptococcaceae bacterium]
MNREFISQLLTALDDPRVQQKIIRIASGEILSDASDPFQSQTEFTGHFPDMEISEAVSGINPVVESAAADLDAPIAGAGLSDDTRAEIPLMPTQADSASEDFHLAFEQIQEENRNLAKEQAQLTEQAKKAESIILHLESALRQSEEQRRLADEIIQEFQQSVAETQMQKQQSESLIADLRDSLSRSEQEKQQSDALIKELQDSMNRLESEKRQSEEQIAELRDSLRQTSTEKQEAVTALGELRSSMGQSEQHKHHSDDLIRDLQSSLDQMKREKKIFREETERLETDNARLYTENHSLKGKIAVKEKEILSLNSEIQHLRTKEQEFQAALLQYKDFTYKQKTSLSAYASRYGNIENFYHLYRSLDISVHQALAHTLSADSPELFFAYGIQWNSIKGLWDFISAKLNVYDKSKIETLTKIWDYFFRLYAQISQEYERLSANAGQQFDEELHQRSADSSASHSEVSEVLLQGYRSKRNQEIKKSIVRT